MHPNEALSRSLRLIPPSPPANLPPRIPHELRTTQGRRSPACPPAGDAAPKSSPFHRQILLPVSPTGSARHRADARRPAPPRRATPHRRAAFSAAVTGHRPRPASAAVPGCPLRLRRQTAPRQNNPASAVAFALGLYYLYRRQTAPRQNNPASAVAFALGLYYLCQRTNAYPL